MSRCEGPHKMMDTAALKCWPKKKWMAGSKKTPTSCANGWNIRKAAGQRTGSK